MRDPNWDYWLEENFDPDDPYLEDLKEQQLIEEEYRNASQEEG